ncbi:uncharacterized protein HMPREF1541_08914 [Cyphellophora europaea CBS 101466]|uniref:MARVEL domain-containing protein n=1 Tax=Cyphellophora europaea (strain CBS 101466) TaxID=1220924 RepID=W2RJH9_CYPE1|nr:uncharacterized protein HMPREF1541_08914 [Cyphellophora europaea CBS 101466]ETN36636.1 hypothetical protein HMPREF1541_08914 [Cyphellophora europaea CBS 101466]
MPILNKSGSSHAVNGLNAIIRFLQLAFGTIVLGIYAEAQSHSLWSRSQYSKELDVAIAAGALSIITGVVCGAIPFLISYYYVAIAFLWDWIIFFTWCAAFALNHKYFSNGIYVAALEESGFPSVDAVVAGQWSALTAMLLFLISALMGPACLLMDRKSLFASRGVVQS